MASHRVGILLWVCVCVLDGEAGICPAGRYGYRCSYQCHCPQIVCNSTSGCQTANCSRGWPGPTCQRENIALNKNTSGSSVYKPSSKAVDGDKRANFYDNSCFHSVFTDTSITSAWWRVDLRQGTLIHDVIIYFRTDHKFRRNSIQMYIADTAASPTDGVNCYNVTGNSDGTDIPDVLKVTCSGEGRYLALYTTTRNRRDSVPALDFCEVEVNVCGPGTFGADCDNYCHCDGDVCNYVTGICPSGVCQPGWQTQTCDTACDAGTFGTNCSNSCHCVGVTCDHMTGVCPNGVCQPGWQTDTCDTACDPGTFGTNCSSYCHCDGERCDHVTGVCPSGMCLPGWQTDTCDTACDPGTFGTNCSSSCHCDGVTCDHVTGVCPSGVCVPGWQTETCGTVCEFSSYGANCNQACSQRNCKDQTSACNHVTGMCVGGCKSGWREIDCLQELQADDPVVLHSISLVIDVVVGVVLTLLLAGGAYLYLLRTGRLTWMHGPVKEGERQDKADTNISQPADNYTSMYELPHSGDDIKVNNYAGLDVHTRVDKKLYDVIQN